MLFAALILPHAPMPAVDNTSDALVDRLLRSEHEAILEVYRAHHTQVRAFARRLVGESSIAE